MEMKKTSKSAVAVAVVLSLAAPSVFAAEPTPPDFSGILSGLSVAAVTGAIVAAGGLKAVANFTKWGANKLAGFFR